MAHNCHGKTKSNGTKNFTHGKTKLTHGKTKLTLGKTKKTNWSAVGQRLLFASEIVSCVTVNKRNGDLCGLGSCEVKKKPMIILKEFILFVLVSTSGASDWQACEDSQ